MIRNTVHVREHSAMSRVREERTVSFVRPIIRCLNGRIHEVCGDCDGVVTDGWSEVAVVSRHTTDSRTATEQQTVGLIDVEEHVTSFTSSSGGS